MCSSVQVKNDSLNMIAFKRQDTMDKKKIEKLKERGWKVGDAVDFLGLSKEEEAYIELKIILAEYLQE